MLAAIKSAIKQTEPYRRRARAVEQRTLDEWVKAGRPAPPPHAVKVRNILALADLFDARTLIETGTYMGDTVAATRDWFSLIYSIELYPPLARAAQQRFASTPHVHILEGNSADLMPSLLPTLPEGRACFWLDGHYSGTGTALGSVLTPILQELETIARCRGVGRDLILIDDARMFDPSNDYPSLAVVQAMIRDTFGREAALSQSDAIVILPG